MRTVLPWLLWLWIALVILAAFLYPPTARGFIGESGRILFFHVPMAWAAFVAFFAAGVWSIRYLYGQRDRRHDRAAAVAVELGMVFCVLATVTGAIWAKIMWGAYWNWDPRQTTIVLALVFYAAYLALRGAVEDEETRSRLAAVYAILGLAVAPFLFFVAPRMASFSLHPEPVINTGGTIDMESRMLQVLLAGSVGFTVLYFWLHGLRCRLEALRERSLAGAD